jgi:hypothetical protein
VVAAIEWISHVDLNNKANGVPEVIFGASLVVLMIVLPGGAGQLLRLGERLTRRLYTRS